MENGLLIGTDPELFKLVDGNIVPAIHLLGTDRDVLLPWGHAYADGAALEFTVTPSGSVDEIVGKVGTSIQQLVNEFGPLSVQSCAPIGLDVIASSKGAGRGDMTVLGCAPDVRVYPWADMPKRPDPTKYPYRSLGGHVHIGMSNKYLDGLTFRQFVTAFMDAIIGTSFAIIGDDEHSRRRHTLYGLSGTVRYTSYGVEYRTPPALAVRDPHIAEATFGTALSIADWVISYWKDQREDYSALLSMLGGVEGMTRVQTAIDEADISQCLELRSEMFFLMDQIKYSPYLSRYVQSLFAYRLPITFLDGSNFATSDFTVEW